MQDDVSDYEGCATLKMICPESDDYKLVFISSDSSSLDDVEDSSSTCSSTNHHSISLDDCDWDYFEPSATTTTKTIFRDCTIQSPFVSPNLQRRRTNLPDIHTTDEEFLAQSSSPTSSDGFVDIRRKLSRFKRTFRHSVNKSNSSCSGSRCDCGHQPQYVPIPVPVPIFVIGDDANSSDVRALQKKQAAELFQLWNTAAPDLLLAHQQRNHIESHKHIASDFLKNYATQVEANATPIPSNDNGHCSNVAYADATSHNQENDTKQEETTLATVNQSNCTTSIADCNKHTANINTSITLHTDRSEQMNSLSTGPTVDLSIPTINARTTTSIPTIETEKNLNHLDLKSRHFVKLKNEMCDSTTTTTNPKNCDVTTGNCAIFNQHLDELNSELSHGIAKSDEQLQKSSYNHVFPTSSNRSTAIDQEKNSIESISAFNLISNFSTSKIKSNSNQPSVKGNKYRDLSKCSASVRKDSFLRDDSTVASSDMAGYLRSESMFSSSSSSSPSSSNSSDGSDVESHHSTTRGKSIKRNYDVLNAKTVNETENFATISVSGSSDCEDLLSNSTRYQPSCSSAPEDSDDNSSSKLHSSLADRRPKSKGFYKVFVVNKKTGSSDSSSPSTNVNSTDDSSDNDTDTEKIVLNYIKPLPENGNETVNYIDDTTTESYDDIDQSDEIVLCSIKRIDDDGDVVVVGGDGGNNNNSNIESRCEKNTMPEPIFLGNESKQNDTTISSDEQSTEDENEQTVIEKMPIDNNGNSCEMSETHKENAIVQQNEHVDLHNQSTTATDVDTAATKIDRMNMDFDSERINDAIKIHAKQMVNDLCESIEQKLNTEPMLSQQMNTLIDLSKNEENTENNLIKMEQQQMPMNVEHIQNDRSQQHQNESNVENTINDLETDPVSMNGFVCEQPVHGNHGVDGILNEKNEQKISTETKFFTRNTDTEYKAVYNLQSGKNEIFK